MATISEIEFQKFIIKNKHVADAVFASCKKRLAKNSKLTTSQLLDAIKNEFSDVYKEDMRIWSYYLNKNTNRILNEISIEQEISKSQQENILFQQESMGAAIKNNKTIASIQEPPREKVNFHSGVSHLPGDIHLEESLPTGDRDMEYAPKEINVVIPPKTLTEANKEFDHPALDLKTKLVSKKELDEKLDSSFPFGRMR
jgi:hypothetical protein